MTTHATNETIFDKRESVVRSYCRNWPAVFETAQGIHQYTEDGQRYLDFFSGAGALNYGHNHPALKQPLIDYLAGDNVVHSLDTYTVAKREFLEAFDELILKPRRSRLQGPVPRPDGDQRRRDRPEDRPQATPAAPTSSPSPTPSTG